MFSRFSVSSRVQDARNADQPGLAGIFELTVYGSPALRWYPTLAAKNASRMGHPD